MERENFAVASRNHRTDQAVQIDYRLPADTFQSLSTSPEKGRGKCRLLSGIKVLSLPGK